MRDFLIYFGIRLVNLRELEGMASGVNGLLTPKSGLGAFLSTALLGAVLAGSAMASAA